MGAGRHVVMGGLWLALQVGKHLVTDAEKCKDPVEFVQNLLDERDKYDRIVMQSFSGDKAFRNALNQVCGCGTWGTDCCHGAIPQQRLVCGLAGRGCSESSA